MALSETDKKPERKEKPFTKVIIRRLPPSMTKEQFLNQVSPMPDYNYMYHVKGDMSLGEHAFSRAYINFVNPQDVYSFKEKFDNYVFVDSKGHEYTAVVEFAPFQKVPKKRGKGRVDPKCNTIETDSYFLEFVANLNKPVEQNEKPEYSLQLNEHGEDKSKDISTPLLEYIKNRRAQKQKIREVRREERERRKKEYEKRKESGKYYDEKPPPKKGVNAKTSSKSDSSKTEPNDHQKTSPENKFKDRKLDEKKERKEIKPRFPKKEHAEGREYTKREDFHKPNKHYEDPKKEETKQNTKKIKKYSERREERKLEAQKAEQKKLEQANKPNLEDAPKSAIEKEPKPAKNEDKSSDNGEKKQESSSERNERRLRNKDRPTIQLYRPGMLSKRKQTEDDSSKSTETKKE